MTGEWTGFYPVKGKDVTEKSRKEGRITDRDAELISEYLSEVCAKYQLSPARVVKLESNLLGWRKNNLFGDYSTLTKKNLYTGISNLNTKKNQNNKLFSQNTKFDYVVILKRFLIWMVRNEYNNNLKELDIHDLKCPAQDKDVTHPDQILTPDEIVSLIGSCTWSRDRAIIAVHYEAATRIGELARLRWRDILWDEYGATVIITDTKTNKVRRSRITKAISASYLATWRDDYTGTPEGDNLVFISSRGTPTTYRIITRVFQSAADSAGVKKRVNTHVFRKSRGTHLIEQGLPLPNLMEMMWANQGTRQIRTYVRLSPGEQDRVMLRHAGVITDEESKQQEHRITARLCPECHFENIPTAKYCNSCGLALEEGSRNLQKKLVNPDDPEDLINKMREMIRIHDMEKI